MLPVRVYTATHPRNGQVQLTRSQTYAHVLTTVCALASTAMAVTPIKVDGKDFVDSKSGDRFQIIGVEYVLTHSYARRGRPGRVNIRHIKCG